MHTNIVQPIRSCHLTIKYNLTPFFSAKYQLGAKEIGTCAEKEFDNGPVE